jgi:hypothetical protein
MDGYGYSVAWLKDRNVLWLFQSVKTPWP